MISAKPEVHNYCNIMFENVCNNNCNCSTVGHSVSSCMRSSPWEEHLTLVWSAYSCALFSNQMAPCPSQTNVQHPFTRLCDSVGSLRRVIGQILCRSKKCWGKLYLRNNRYILLFFPCFCKQNSPLILMLITKFSNKVFLVWFEIIWN